MMMSRAFERALILGDDFRRNRVRAAANLPQSGLDTIACFPRIRSPTKFSSYGRHLYQDIFKLPLSKVAS
jgi:hypothetical protein